jgi:hypothetical protein
MENNTAPIEHQPIEAVGPTATLHESVTKAFESMGSAMLAIAKDQKTIAETINQVIADRNQQLELVGTLLRQNETLAERVLALTKLVDSDHAAIEVLTAMSGMSKAAKC